MYKTTHSRHYRVFLQTLIDVRVEKGITQVDLARTLNESQSWISKCERGVRRLDLVEVGLWCAALKVGLGTFVRRYEVAIRRSLPRDQLNDHRVVGRRTRRGSGA